MIAWGAPVWLWAMLLLIPAGGLLALAWYARQRALARLLPTLHDGCATCAGGRRFFWKGTLALAGAGLLCMALADPRYGTRTDVSGGTGVCVLFLLDVSKSMLADDARPTRLAAAKRGIRDVFKGLNPGDRAGIVAFAGDAVLYCPPTSDLGAFEMFLDQADTGIVARGGTDLGGAIETALRSIEDARAPHSALVVFSDGGDHAEQAVVAAKKARARGIPVHCVGVGGTSRVPIRIRDAKGDLQYIRDRAGVMATTRLEETLLRETASAGGGMVLVMDPQGHWRTALLDRGIRAVAEGELEQARASLQIRRFQIPLLAAYFLLLIEAFISLRGPAGMGREETP